MAKNILDKVRPVQQHWQTHQGDEYVSCSIGIMAHYEPACIVYNKGPLTIPDFLKQRRRIYAGHLQVRDQQNYQASTMKVVAAYRLSQFYDEHSPTSYVDSRYSSPRRVCTYARPL